LFGYYGAGDAGVMEVKVDGLVETVADSFVAGEAPAIRPIDRNVTARCRGAA
jgi:hypothetical protein